MNKSNILLTLLFSILISICCVVLLLSLIIREQELRLAVNDWTKIDYYYNDTCCNTSTIYIGEKAIATPFKAKNIYFSNNNEKYSFKIGSYNSETPISILQKNTDNYSIAFNLILKNKFILDNPKTLFFKKIPKNSSDDEAIFTITNNKAYSELHYLMATLPPNEASFIDGFLIIPVETKITLNKNSESNYFEQFFYYQNNVSSKNVLSIAFNKNAILYVKIHNKLLITPTGFNNVIPSDDYDMQIAKMNFSQHINNQMPLFMIFGEQKSYSRIELPVESLDLNYGYFHFSLAGDYDANWFGAEISNFYCENPKGYIVVGQERTELKKGDIIEIKSKKLQIESEGKSNIIVSGKSKEVFLNNKLLCKSLWNQAPEELKIIIYGISTPLILAIAGIIYSLISNYLLFLVSKKQKNRLPYIDR